jgi:hypothetical protein
VKVGTVCCPGKTPVSRPHAMTMARKGRPWAKRVTANVAVAAEVRRGKWPEK